MHGTKNPTADGYLLIQTDVGSGVAELADRIAETAGVVKVERVNGAYDVIAETREQWGDAGMPSAAEVVGGLEGVLRVIPLSVAAHAVSSRNDEELKALPIAG
jgi:hypothetical protein